MNFGADNKNQYTSAALMLQTYRGVNVFFSHPLWFVFPQTCTESPPPTPPSWSGCKSLLLCARPRGCVHSLPPFQRIWPQLARASSAPTAERFISWKTSSDFRLIQFPGHRSLHFFVRVCRNVLKTPSTEVAMAMVTLHTIKEWQSQQWASIHQSGRQTYHWTICQPPPTPGWSPAATSQEEALSWGLMC